MKISVLGSGNGGCAVAFHYASAGHEVQLFDFERFPDNIRAVRSHGGIHSEGALEGFAPVAYAGHDVERAVSGADVVYLVGPAYSTGPFAEACGPHLAAGQTVIVCPSSCAGAVVFKNAAGLDLRDERIVVAETNTLPYAVRLMEPGRIRVFHLLRDGLLAAALPAGNTSAVVDLMREVYPGTKAARNVLQTSLQNGNPVIHPSVTLLNAGLLERTGGDFLFYEEGVTPAVGRLMKAVDDERIAIGSKLGVEILSDPELGRQQGYMTEASYDTGYSKAPGFEGIKAQGSLDHRYLNEDAGFGLVFIKSLGDQLGVETPNISAVIRLASVVMDRDYLGEAARTVESLGLSGHSAAELMDLVS